MQVSEHLGQPYPSEINYNDRFSCFGAAVAYAMFRAGAAQELWRPSAIDEITGREPGGLTYDTPAGLLALMEQGVPITNFHAFDNMRFVSEGLPYLEEYYAQTWLGDDPQNFYEYWTPQRLASQQDYMARLLKVTPSLGKLWEVKKVNPTIEDIKAATAIGRMVLLAVKRYDENEKNIVHYYLILPPDSTEEASAIDSSFVVFDPQVVPPIIDLPIKDFVEHEFRPEWGMVVLGAKGSFSSSVEG